MPGAPAAAAANAGAAAAPAPAKRTRAKAASGAAEGAEGAPAAAAPAKRSRAKAAPAAASAEAPAAAEGAEGAPAAAAPAKKSRAKAAPAAPAAASEGAEPAEPAEPVEPAEQAEPEEGAGAGAGAGGAKKPRAPRKPALPPHACSGPDPSTFTALPHQPAATLAAFLGALPPPRPAGAATCRVLCYNVNGLRGVLRGERREEVLAWLAREDPDVLCVQEVKADEEAVAKEGLAGAFPTHPHAYFACGEPSGAGFKKGYAGVAIFSKTPALSVTRGLGSAAHDGQGRVLTARFAWGTLVNVYVPNSGQNLDRLAYRTEEFDPALRAHLAQLAAGGSSSGEGGGAGGGAGGGGGGGGAVLCVGDFNVAHQNCDVEGWKGYRNKIAGFCDAEREQFAALLAAGYTDLWRAANPTSLQYTYYSVRNQASREQNKGWRVDYALGANLKGAEVVQHSTWPKNDHLPFSVTFPL